MTRSVIALMALLLSSNTFAFRASNGDADIEVIAEVIQAAPYYQNRRLELKLLLRVNGHIFGNVKMQQPTIDNVIVLYDADIEFSNEYEKQVENPRYLMWKTFELFPRKPGELTIPAIPMEVIYSNPGSRTYEMRTIKTTPMVLTIDKPPGFPEGHDTIISTELQLARSLSPQDVGALQVGDSVTLTYSVLAANTNSMLLPKLNLGEINGASRYLKAEQAKDYKNSQGKPVGVSSQQVTYIFQQPGEVAIPAQRVYWWDSVKQRVELSELAALQWHVQGPPVPFWTYQRAGRYSVFLILLLLGGWQLLSRGKQLVSAYHRLNRTELKKMQSRYWKSYRQQQWLTMWQSLQQMANCHHQGQMRLKILLPELPALSRLSELAFNDRGEPLTPQEAKILFDACKLTKGKHKIEQGYLVQLNR